MIVWLASYPRSGNTFFRLLLHALYGQDTYSIYDDREIERMGMASILGQRRRPGLTRMRREGHTYFVKTHELPSDDSPAIYFVRDGRDASVSYAHFMLGNARSSPGIHTRAAWKLLGQNGFQRTLDNVVRDGLWQQHVLAWTRDRPRGRTVVIRFEDLISDPTYWSQTALKEFEIGLQPGRNAPLTFDVLHARWPQYFRKGRVGSWREEMPEYIHEMFWRRGRTAMQRFGYTSDMPAALQPAFRTREGPAVPVLSCRSDEGAQPSVSMTGLGRDSDWGTALFQYMFLKRFARRYGMVAEVPPWSGQSLFQECDAPVGRQHDVVVCDNVTPLRERSAPVGNQSVVATRVRELAASGKTVYLLNDPLLGAAELQLPFRHADLDGPFVLHPRMLAPDRDYLKALLKPAPAYESALNETLKRLRGCGKTLIGLHCLTRNGQLEILDWDSYAVPLKWYVDLLTKIWQRVEDPVLLLCSDDESRALSVFAKFDPITFRKLAAEMPALSQAFSVPLPGRNALTFIEWLLLSKCDVMVIANDFSSFTAAMMNGSGVEFWKPSSDRFELISFEPWNDEPTIAPGRRLTLAGELAQRIRFMRASDSRRSLPEIIAWALRLYARILRGRVANCYLCHGVTGLLREIISPHFYLAARRAYSHSERISGTKQCEQ